MINLTMNNNNYLSQHKYFEFHKNFKFPFSLIIYLRILSSIIIMHIFQYFHIINHTLEARHALSLVINNKLLFILPIEY